MSPKIMKCTHKFANIKNAGIEKMDSTQLLPS